MMYLLTEQEHAQIVDALNIGIARHYDLAENLRIGDALATLKAMKPVEPCGHTSTSWLSNPHAGHFSAQKTDCFNVPLYAKEQQ